MNDNQEKRLLRNAATILRDELETRCETSGFQARIQMKPANGYTDGWYVLVGKIRQPKARVELWLDRYPGQGPRRWYYGFRIQDARELQSLTKQVSTPYRPKITFTRKSRKRIKGKDMWQLIPRLPHQNFDTPIYEDYYSGHRFYGMYDSAKSWSDTSIRRVVERAAGFFSAVICSRTRTVEAVVEEEVYPQLESQIRREHLIRERNPRLAKACKQRDGYRCRVCGITFEEIYGNLGRGFAESHHLHPLGRAAATRKTRLEDLATVCANCHRMLHLMRGSEHDLDKLRREMGNQRKGK